MKQQLYSCLPIAVCCLGLAGCNAPKSGGKNCYEFQLVHESCYGVVAKNWGCRGKREYTWKAGCLGYIPDAYFANKLMCFEEVLKDEGVCTEGRSLPPGGKIP